MTPALLKALTKIYRGSRSTWDPAIKKSRYIVPSDFSVDTLQALADINMSPNTFQCDRHDETLAKLLTLQSDPRLTMDMGARFYVAGLAGRVLEGRQVMLDVLQIRALVPHDFAGAHHCEICGLEPEHIQDATQTRLFALWGASTNEFMSSVLPCITAILPQTTPDVRQDDLDRLSAVLDVVEQAAEDETPGKLLARLGQSKVIPKSNKNHREGLMQTLAELGILPNDYIAPVIDGPRTQKQLWEASRGPPGSSRSDIVLPFAGWRGRNGVSRDRADEVFGTLV